MADHSEYFAHSENRAGKRHSLQKHLGGVGALAESFAKRSNSELSEAARWAGLLHDLGKYRDEFQQYLRAEREGSTETHHAVYGAALAYSRSWLGPAFAIAGHHAGLHDTNDLQMLIEGSKYDAVQRVRPLIERFERELGKIPEEITEPEFVINNNHSTEFYIRMLLNFWRRK
jgi:CRISPR-associated endonuclease/helicase Cas3